jgi:hypothetical protein
MKGLKKSIVALALTASCSNFAFATDGTLGATSTGTSTVSITTTDMVEITSSSWDYAIGSYSGSSGVDSLATKKVCVFSNVPTGNYTVTGSSDWTAAGGAADNTETNFYLKRAATTDTIQYTVRWNPTGNGTGGALLTGNAASADMGNVDASYPCNTDTANFQIQMTHNNIMSKPSGSYSGVLTLLITPSP